MGKVMNDQTIKFTITLIIINIHMKQYKYFDLKINSKFYEKLSFLIINS